MSTYTVHLTTTASYTIDVEVDDDLDEQEAREAATDKALEEAPSDVCGHCGGWRQKWNLELGEWESARNPDGTEIQPERR